MALDRTIKCDVKGCPAKCTEKEHGDGFPGWGHVAGAEDEETRRTTAYLCPEHLSKVMLVLNGG